MWRDRARGAVTRHHGSRNLVVVADLPATARRSAQAAKAKRERHLGHTVIEAQFLALGDILESDEKHATRRHAHVGIGLAGVVDQIVRATGASKVEAVTNLQVIVVRAGTRGGVDGRRVEHRAAETKDARARRYRLARKHAMTTTRRPHLGARISRHRAFLEPAPNQGDSAAGGHSTKARRARPGQSDRAPFYRAFGDKKQSFCAPPAARQIIV